MRACSFLVIFGVACAFDSSGQNSAGDETTSSSGDPTSTSTSPTTTATTATTAMTSDDTDTTTSMTSTMTTTTTTTTTDPDSSGTSPVTTDDPTTEESESTAPKGCAVDNGGCDPDATCSDADANVTCTCNPGFVGPGTVCATTPVMPTLRAELPCVGGACIASSSTCTTAGSVDDQVVMAGEAGVIYGVQLAVRGVLEHKEYANGDCDGQWCIGGDPDPSPWNEVTIIVSDPPGEYHPNAGEGGVFEVFAVDEERTVAIAAGATITIEIDGNGACSIENVDEIVIPGVPPAPEPFDGQFLQLDLVGATIAG